MKLEVLRYQDTGQETHGMLFIDGEFECHTLEDEERTEKVWGETRIPEGTYEVALRTEGTHHMRYSLKFPNMHKGMLHVLDVPNFQWILIHIGNTDDDTAGCLLVGRGISGNALTNSTGAYIDLYKKVISAMDKGEKVTIKYIKYGANHGRNSGAGVNVGR